MKGKVAEMKQPETMEVENYDLPTPEKGAMLLKVLRTNVCGSEIHIWKGHHPTKKQGVLGHEMVGEIAELGEGTVTDFSGEEIKEGDRITSTYFQTCRKCAMCRKGEFNLCENAYEFWNKPAAEAPHFHGSFASHYYVHPDVYFYKVPDNIPDKVAASANCALSQVYFGLDRAELKYGESVVIQGAGGLGLNAAAIAKEKGATVIVIDGVAPRLENAKKFGADHVIDMNEYKTPEERAERVKALTGGEGADVGMELSGVPAAFQEGIHLVAGGGRYVSIGNVSPGKTTEFDPGLLTRKSITIYPIVRYHPWYLKKSLDFLEKNIDKYPFEDMIDGEFTFENIKEALDQSAARKVNRASITFEG
ncbi:zinc-binding dehydrogenase [Salinicoccus kekensis]|uniref:Threonine dehydrogenase-like Zn-dependent dehydrogenase n=1 Tax=Salinicoccus kekensis TaxID=714307 RepID=A0A285USR9_9STAP|nr:zinc-binding dehydrogenase [Salinicoccus kekensis]SOC44833.1 threonine dehydrogenase-like Zn-dependent dehydrogenase [Salinicoccus kekensis]